MTTNPKPAPVATPRTLQIQIGALCAPLSRQLAGLISAKDADQLDRDNDAITRCNLMGYLPDAATERARKKLLAKCQRAVSQHTKGGDAK